jgi:SNF2 family DNA or RNA helicase
MPVRQPQSRRRIVILDSSSESERSLSDSVISIDSSRDNDGEKDGKPSEIVDLVKTMNQVTIDPNSNDKSMRRPAFRRGGIDSLNFDSDSDSSLEVFEPTFKPKTKTIALTDSSHSANRRIPQHARGRNMPISDKGRNKTDDKRNKKTSGGAKHKDTGCASDELWALDHNQKEYFLRSSASSQMPKFRIPAKLYGQLFEHQQDGVSWIAGLHCQGIGGLLGDDMGMGKTYMALTLLGGLMRARTIRNALIIAPLSVLRSWESEASKVVKQCVPNVRTVTVSSGMSKATRYRHLQAALEW